MHLIPGYTKPRKVAIKMSNVKLKNSSAERSLSSIFTSVRRQTRNGSSSGLRIRGTNYQPRIARNMIQGGKRNMRRKTFKNANISVNKACDQRTIYT